MVCKTIRVLLCNEEIGWYAPKQLNERLIEWVTSKLGEFFDSIVFGAYSSGQQQQDCKDPDNTYYCNLESKQQK